MILGLKCSVIVSSTCLCEFDVDIVIVKKIIFLKIRQVKILDFQIETSEDCINYFIDNPYGICTCVISIFFSYLLFYSSCLNILQLKFV